MKTQQNCTGSKQGQHSTVSKDYIYSTSQQHHADCCVFMLCWFKELFSVFLHYYTFQTASEVLGFLKVKYILLRFIGIKYNTNSN